MVLKPIDKTRIVNRYRGLLRTSANVISPDDHRAIRKAFNLIIKLYGDLLHDSGNPYVFHLIDVARVCVEEIGLGTTSLIAALLHETIERKQLTSKDIEAEFGIIVATIVEGLTNISSIDLKDPKSQAENFGKLMLSISSDARVILIKLAERLETMRSLESSTKDIQYKNSLEAFYLYAPLAHKLGLYKLKSEMEDLAMKFTYANDYNLIVRKLKNTATKRNKFIHDFIAPFREELSNKGFDFEIKGRPKSVYSIWKKMQKQKVEFEEVYDVFAIRIVLNSPPESEKSDCWQVYSIITDKYTPNPERMRDWISVPKSNGYESLHTTVLGPEGKYVEVQIRTVRMDEIAERGLAAHWKYKGVQQEKGFDGWFTKIREILESPELKPDMLTEQLNTNLYSKEIFVFTPKGDIRKLPVNSTVLDFAFDIHTNIGCKCTGAKVNNRIVSIKHVIKNGDMVEIITSKNQKPKEDWLNFVITSKARSRIKQTIRDEKNKEIAEGKEILTRRLKNWKVDNFDDTIKFLLKHLKIKSPLTLYSQIANEKIDISNLKSIITKSDKAEEPAEIKPADTIKKPETKATYSSDDYLLIDEKLVNLYYKLAKCCNPIFGDDIFGFVTINEGIKIHRSRCPNANQLRTRWGYRIVKARWKETLHSGSFQATIRITGMDELGIVNRITEVISNDVKVNMRNISFSSSNGIFEGKIQVFVPDTKHLEMLLYRINQIKGVLKTTRLK